MEPFIALIISSVFVFLYIISRNSIKIDIIQTFDLLILVVFLYVYLPSLILYLDPSWVQYYEFSFTPSKIYLSASLGMLALFVGYSFADFMLAKKNLAGLLPYFKIHSNEFLWKNMKSHEVYVPIMFVLFTVLLILVDLYIRLPGFSSLIKNVALGIMTAAEIDDYRIGLRHNALGPVGTIIPHLLFVVIPILILVAKIKKRKFFNYFAGFIILLGLFFLISKFFRGMLVFYLLTCLLSIVVISDDIRTRRSIVIFCGFALFTVFILTLYRSSAEIGADSKSIYELGLFALERRLITSVCQFGFVLDHFEALGSMWGKTYLINMMALLPGPDLDFNGILFKKMGYAHEGGTATITLFGEFYSDFGYPGIVIGGWLTGGIARLLEGVRHLSRSFLGQVFYVSLSIIFCRIVFTGYGGIFVPLGVALFILSGMFILNYFLRFGFSKITNHNKVCVVE